MTQWTTGSYCGVFGLEEVLWISLSFNIRGIDCVWAGQHCFLGAMCDVCLIHCWLCVTGRRARLFPVRRSSRPAGGSLCFLGHAVHW